MQTNLSTRRIVGGLALVLMMWPAQTVAHPSSLPEAAVKAHTVFLENETGFAELQYALILELNKWGRFELASSRETADLVVRLDAATRVRAVPDGEFPAETGGSNSAESEVPKGYTRIALVEPKTGVRLWSDIHKTEGGKVKSGHLLDGMRDAFRDYDRRKK
jgi:hypothetical protein